MKIAYNDLTLNLPANVMYIATDSDGRIYGYSEEPVADIPKGVWAVTSGKVRLLSKLCRGNFADWSASLVRVDELLVEQTLRKVFYKGSLIQVPVFATHIAVNPDGTVLVFEGKPTKSDKGWHGRGYVVFSHRARTEETYTSWGSSLAELRG